MIATKARSHKGITKGNIYAFNTLCQLRVLGFLPILRTSSGSKI
jgi:hypothetical protein